MNIYKAKRDFTFQVGISVSLYKKGDIFYQEVDDKTIPERPKNVFYPAKGGYQIYSGIGDGPEIEELLEFVEENPHDHNYYTDKIYTEHDMQMAITNNNPNPTQ